MTTTPRKPRAKAAKTKVENANTGLTPRQCAEARRFADECIAIASLSERPELDALIEQAKMITMTPAQEEAQRRSFVYGNCAIDNPLVTRSMVDEVADDLSGYRDRVDGWFEKIRDEAMQKVARNTGLDKTPPHPAMDLMKLLPFRYGGMNGAYMLGLARDCVRFARAHDNLVIRNGWRHWSAAAARGEWP